MEGKEVSDILLDTGCSRTMVHRDLVPEGKQLEGEAVTICCAHGDVSLYPLAEIDLKLEGVEVKVKAAVSDSLPVSVLLGTDVPELGRLLRSNPRTVHTTVGEALVVMTRAQARSLEEAEARRAAAEGASGATPHSISEEEEVAPQDVMEESSHPTQDEGGEVGDMVEPKDVVEPGDEPEDETTDMEVMGSLFSHDLFLLAVSSSGLRRICESGQQA